jgi:hypothetical protein
VPAAQIPFPAPPGTAWVLKAGKPKLIIPGGKLAAQIVKPQLRLAKQAQKRSALLAWQTAKRAARETVSPVAAPAPVTEAPVYQGAVPVGMPEYSYGGGSGVPIPGGYEWDAGYSSAEPSSASQTVAVPAGVISEQGAGEPAEPWGELDPEGYGDFNTPARSVYGSPHTSFEYADDLEYGNDPGAAAWSEAGEGLTVPDSMPDIPEDADYSSRELDDLEFEGFYSGPLAPGLSGVMDSVTAYWTDRFNKALAYFKGLLAKFWATRAQLETDLALADHAIAVAAENPKVSDSQRDQLENLRGKIKDALDSQGSLENRVKQVQEKVAVITGGQDKGLGIVPIIIGAAAVAVVAAVAGAVYMHMRSADEIHSQLDMVAKGVLSAEQIATVKAGGATGAAPWFSFGNIGGLLVPALVIGGIVLFTRSKKAAA